MCRLILDQSGHFSKKRLEQNSYTFPIISCILVYFYEILRGVRSSYGKNSSGGIA